MTTTLTADVGIAEQDLPVSGLPTRTVPFLAQIEEEHVLVEAGGDTGWRVHRGFNGTARSAHPSGSAVTPVVVLVQTDPPTAPPPAQGGGGVQTVSLLPPFHVAFNTPGLVDPTDPVNGIVCLTIPDGALYRVIALAGDAWTNDSQLTVARGASGPVLAGYTTAGSGGTRSGIEMVIDPGVSPNAENIVNNLPSWALADGETDLYVAVFSITDPPTSGSADIYALIATPS